MSNYYINLYYDPQRQGYDTSVWRTLNGDPIVGGNRLQLALSSIVHYGDILRGDITMNMNISVPTSGDLRSFGLYQPNRGAYIYFDITGTTFSAKTSDGTNSYSTSITWQSAWSSADTDFRILWEGGTAKFYVGGVHQASITDVSVPGDPLSFYITNGNVDTISLKYINAKGIQSFFLNEALENSAFQSAVVEQDRINISEAVTMLLLGLVPTASDSLTISESVTVSRDREISVSDSLTVSESTSLAGPPVVSDSLTISESVTLNVSPAINVSDSLTVSESSTVANGRGINVSDQLTLSESISANMPGG